MLLPGLGQILQKRFAYGAVLFTLVTVTPLISSLTGGSPDFNKFSVLNPFLLLIDAVQKNNWTTGFHILIITIFLVLLVSLFESILWCKKNTR